MSTQKLVNIKLADFERFLRNIGCQQVSIKGGHAKWTKSELTRPIIYQTHKDPVPTFIVKTILKDLGMSPQDFFDNLKK